MPQLVSAPIATQAALSFRLITRMEDLHELVPSWQILHEESAAAEPMRGPHWLTTWWDIYGRDRALRVGLFYEGAALVGVAPLCARRYVYRPGIPFRRLEFLGSDVDEDDGVCSNYLQLTTRAGHEDRVGEEFAHRLQEGAFGRWDECVLAALEQDGASRLAETLKRAGLAPEWKPIIPAPYAPLAASWEEFHRALPKKNRHDINQALRNFQAWAGEDWRVEFAQTTEQVEQAMAVLAELHCRRWQTEGHGGAFGAPRFRAFHDRQARYLLEHGQLLLMTLRVRSTPVAATYSFLANRKVYLYQCGRALDVPPKVRLGILSVIFGMQEAMRRGLVEFDFLAGEAQYKSMFTKIERTLGELRLVRFGFPELTRRVLRSTANVARKLGGRIRSAAENTRQLFGRNPDVPESVK